MKATFREKITLYRDVFLVFMKKELRNQQKIEEEYDQGLYKKYVDAEIWSKNKNEISILGLTEPKRFEQNKMSFFRYDNVILKDHYVKIWDLWEKEFVEIFTRFVDEKDEIVELGCGYGRNLFALRRNNFKNPMMGYDISKNAINIGKKLNEKFNSNIEFDILDMTKEFSKEKIENKTIFTYTSLEQTKYHLEEILDKLIHANPKQVIHFETIPQLLPHNLFGITVNLNRYRKDYQTKLLDILHKYEEEISISHLEKLKTCPSVFNPIMMVRYQPI